MSDVLEVNTKKLNQAHLAGKIGPGSFRANTALKNWPRERLGAMKNWPRARLGQQGHVKLGPVGFAGQP